MRSAMPRRVLLSQLQSIGQGFLVRAHECGKLLKVQEMSDFILGTGKRKSGGPPLLHVPW